LQRQILTLTGTHVPRIRPVNARLLKRCLESIPCHYIEKTDHPAYARLPLRRPITRSNSTDRMLFAHHPVFLQSSLAFARSIITCRSSTMTPRNHTVTCSNRDNRSYPNEEVIVALVPDGKDVVACKMRSLSVEVILQTIERVSSGSLVR
jgi:hypothetical protein